MTETDLEETPKETDKEKNDTDQSDSSSEIEDLREEVADLYVTMLDAKKEGIVWTVAWLGVSLNPLKKEAKEYLLSFDTQKEKDIFDKLWKKFEKAFMEKLTGGTLIDYNKTELDKMKSLIAQNKDSKTALENIKSQIEEGKDPTANPLPEADGQEQQKQVPPVTVETALTGKRQQVLKQLDEVVSYDSNHAVKYTWGGRESLAQWLDCSGLLIYTMHHAGLESPGGDSRAMFKKLSTEKLDMNADGKIENLTTIKPGDALFWNTTNPEYDWKQSSIPTIKKDGNDYRIHHVAFVKEVTSSGELVIVESNGSEGIVQRKIDYKHELEESKHKSELYVGHVDYDQLLAYVPKDKSKEQTV